MLRKHRGMQKHAEEPVIKRGNVHELNTQETNPKQVKVTAAIIVAGKRDIVETQSCMRREVIL